MSADSLFDLTPPEKLQLVEDLWDDLAAIPSNVPIYDWQKEELAQRKANLMSKPSSGVSWQDIQARVRSCYGYFRLASLIAVLVAMPTQTIHADEINVPVTFSGGHDLAKNDFGRPCTLMAAALDVKPDEFRKAFSGVTPARGRGPTGAEAQRNKEALMKILAPLGVTNERMDEVANYYRFRPQSGELWPTKPAKAHAVVEDGKIKKVVITDPGSGYCTPPKVTVKGFEKVRLEAKIHYDKNLKKNGGIASVELATKKPAITQR